MEMRTIDIVAAGLLVVGGFNWGLIGFFKFDLVSALLGQGSVASTLVYILVGLSALYQALSLRAIQSRWGVKA